jgi:hypothetical protein
MISPWIVKEDRTAFNISYILETPKQESSFLLHRQHLEVIGWPREENIEMRPKVLLTIQHLTAL